MKLIPFKRKREHKTNYRKRLLLLKSKIPRLIVRVSNKNIYLQLVEYSESGDKIITSVNTKDLEKLGWKHSRNNIPSAYLVGLLLAKKTNIKKAVLDIGLQKNTPNGRIYASVKGIIDGGIKVPCKEIVFPSEERISGAHLKKDFSKSIAKVKENLK